jgi:hypothetical protein
LIEDCIGSNELVVELLERSTLVAQKLYSSNLYQGSFQKHHLTLTIHYRQSYDILLEVEYNSQKQINVLDLKSPYFRYTGQPITAPPGNTQQCPSEKLSASGYYSSSYSYQPNQVAQTSGKGGEGGGGCGGYAADGVEEYLSDSSPVYEEKRD